MKKISYVVTLAAANKSTMSGKQTLSMPKSNQTMPAKNNYYSLSMPEKDSQKNP